MSETRTTSTVIPSTTHEAEPPHGWGARGFRSPLERGQLALLLALLVLTVGAWALTVYQAQSMDMPMGVVPREASVALDPTVPTHAMGDMDAMGNMSMDDAADMAATGMAGPAGHSLGLLPLSWPGR
jgi:predicted metal-binding membrane protein